MNKHLIIFATPDYLQSQNSLKKSAINYFDSIHCVSLDDIDVEFKKNNENILSQKRGAGYFLWKPYFINKILQTMEENDILFYVDAGNVFISDPEILYSHLNKNNGIVLFDNRDGMQNGLAAQNFISCKRDCFVLMDCDNEEYVFGTHLNASYIILENNEFTKKFTSEWLEICQNEDILTDTPNRFGDNYPGYYDHRHDQSILSLLAIKHKINPLIDPSEWGNKCGKRNFPQMFFHHRRKNFS